MIGPPQARIEKARIYLQFALSRLMLSQEPVNEPNSKLCNDEIGSFMDMFEHQLVAIYDCENHFRGDDYYCNEPDYGTYPERTPEINNLLACLKMTLFTFASLFFPKEMDNIPWRRGGVIVEYLDDLSLNLQFWVKCCCADDAQAPYLSIPVLSTSLFEARFRMRKYQYRWKEDPGIEEQTADRMFYDQFEACLAAENQETTVFDLFKNVGKVNIGQITTPSVT